MTPAVQTIPDFTDVVLDGRFHVIRRIGHGSYGIVYVATDAEKDDTERAIKVVHKASRRSVEDIYKEVEIHSTVGAHRNVVSIHDAFEDKDHVFFVLDFCRGGDLRSQLSEKNVYASDEEKLRNALVSLIDAVLACHNKGIYHRDLKPENILTNEDGSAIYLSDFGLATNHRMTSELNCGTVAYMSPECIGLLTSFRPYAPRYGDVWSIGIIIVNMVTDTIPWAKASVDDCCFNQFLEEPFYLRNNFAISDELDSILQRIFRLNPLLRISLADLRREILKVRKFFDDSRDPAMVCMHFDHPLRAQERTEVINPYAYSFGRRSEAPAMETDEDVVTGSATVRPSPAAYGEAPPPESLPTPRFSTHSGGYFSSDDSSSSSEDEDDIVMYPRPPNPVDAVGGVCGTKKYHSGWVCHDPHAVAPTLCG